MKAEEHSTNVRHSLSKKVSLIDFLGKQNKDTSNNELEYTLENGDNDQIRTHNVNTLHKNTLFTPLQVSLMNAITAKHCQAEDDHGNETHPSFLLHD